MQRRSTAAPLAFFILMASARNAARAEDSISYKLENYTETGGRVGVQTQGLVANQEIGTDMQFGLTMVTDAIAGATPTGIPAPEGSSQVPLAHLSDHRKAWEGDLARQFSRVNVSAGFSESREHDYISKGISLNTLSDFNEKNTTLLAGVAGHDDSVETFYDPQHLYVGKHSLSAIVGVTQLIDPLTKVTLNVTWSRETGYLSDQYKVVEQSVELFPGAFFPLIFSENRPGEHNSGDAYLAVNRSFPTLDGALEGSYRFYGDTYGIAANTLEIRWLQKVGRHFTVSPQLRLYEQGAANFYYYDMRSTSLVPTNVPDPSGPAYSSDYRLSSLTTTTGGIKVAWNPSDRFQVDVAYDRYAMRGRDGTTPQSAYPRANLVTFGARISW
ncbi:MAG TPA: DUF3570 domain-containing protein [Opitutaceae bacterium]